MKAIFGDNNLRQEQIFCVLCSLNIRQNAFWFYRLIEAVSAGLVLFKHM